MKSVPSTSLALVSALVLLAGCERESVPMPMELAPRTADMGFTPQRTPWSAPVRLGPAINSPTANDIVPSMSPDDLSLYFCSDRSGGLGGNDLYVSRRSSSGEDFEEVVNLGPMVNSTAGECAATFSIDGTMMLFTSNRAGGAGGNDLWMTTRTDAADDFAWTTPVRLGSGINTAASEVGPYLTRFRGNCGDQGDGAEEEACAADLYFERSTATAGTEIFVVTIDRQGQVITAALPVSELNSPAFDGRPTIRFDLREAMFHSTRGGNGVVNIDLFVSLRRSPNDPWPTPERIAELSTPGREERPNLSRDGRTLYFTRGVTATDGDIWMSSR